MRFPLLALLLSLSFLPGPSLAQGEKAGGERRAAVGGSTSYLDLKPAFIVNYGGAGKLRYLKADVALRLGGGSAGQSQIRHHMPYIRHTIVMRLSRATEEELSSMEGRELLRQDVLEETRNMLIKEEGQQFVDDLLFSSFIVQR
ncbi:MAG: flagellar basal body-associated protein FliL [Oceanicoccus sp.]|uniref:flagellar basal body-associated FliL family protein n=1 Tax=Oceanicoccus sp. TaxID=2691044 RepID=UPI00262C747C|nr:flagellar basal body-associated FliL family protein [Oceanicoccus sp.]MCP3907394.1 flagellar basal body-associated protein FliL [Oceanicoccus sp.]MDG1772405.1 flagellar basal body-associated FliL family protein [Oceanicoccus sp.]